jgi:hypothetical protein
LQRQGGDPADLNYAVKLIIVPQHGVLSVNVAATEEVDLLAAIDDPSVGKISAFLPPAHPASSLSVET